MSLSSRSLLSARTAALFLATVFLAVTVGSLRLLADGNRENSGASGAEPVVIDADCRDDGTWHAYAAISINAGAVNAGVVVDVGGANVAITDAVVDNGYVDGTPAKIARGVADVLFKDGGIATDDAIVLEITAPRGQTAVSNFTTPISIGGTRLGLKGFREAPTTARKNIAVTVAGTCE